MQYLEVFVSTGDTLQWWAMFVGVVCRAAVTVKCSWQLATVAVSESQWQHWWLPAERETTITCQAQSDSGVPPARSPPRGEWRARVLSWPCQSVGRCLMFPPPTEAATRCRLLQARRAGLLVLLYSPVSLSRIRGKSHMKLTIGKSKSQEFSDVPIFLNFTNI